MPFKGVFGFFCGENMAITIPEPEPLDFYSGETVKWKRTDLADYPAPTWTLYCTLQKTGTRIQFNSSQDGSTTSHLISLTPANTAGYTVGIYHWVVEAPDGTDVYVVDEGYMEIKTDFAEQSSGYDDRSVAKKMVDAYGSLFSNQITNSTLEQLNYSIAGPNKSTAKAWQAPLPNLPRHKHSGDIKEPIMARIKIATYEETEARNRSKKQK
jgi:hypothetical protein